MLAPANQSKSFDDKVQEFRQRFLPDGSYAALSTPQRHRLKA